MSLSQSAIDRLEEVIPTVNIELQSYKIYNFETRQHFNKSPEQIQEINTKFGNYQQQRDNAEIPQQMEVISPVILWPEQAREIDQAYYFRPDSQYSEPSESSYVLFFVAVINYSLCDSYSDYLLSPLPDVEIDN